MRKVPLPLSHLSPRIGNFATRRSQSFKDQLRDYGRLPFLQTGKDRFPNTGENALLLRVCTGKRVVGAPLGVTTLGHRDDHRAAPAPI
jgi:hypothetical protein